MLSAEESIDLASSEPLCDWKRLKPNVHFPNYYKFLQSNMLPSKLVTYFTVDRLGSACYICAAFLHAHRIARQQLHDFIGNNLPLSIYHPNTIFNFLPFSIFPILFSISISSINLVFWYNCQPTQTIILKNYSIFSFNICTTRILTPGYIKLL